MKALEPRAQGRAARALTLAIPLVVPAGMRVLFPVLARRLGGRADIWPDSPSTGPAAT